MSDTFRGARDTALNKIDKNPCTCGFYFLGEETDFKKCVLCVCVFDTSKYKGEKEDIGTFRVEELAILE